MSSDAWTLLIIGVYLVGIAITAGIATALDAGEDAAIFVVFWPIVWFAVIVCAPLFAVGYVAFWVTRRVSERLL